VRASVEGVQVSDSSCNFPCTGNNGEACGGNSLLSVYQDPTFPYDNTSIISDYTPQGCWTDSSSSGRTLVYRQNALSTATLTVEQCLFSCKADGYPLAGVEFGVSELHIEDSATLLFTQRLTAYRANVTVVLCLEMALCKSRAASAACHAMAMLPRLAEGLLSLISTLPRISNQVSRAKA
jgi:hypothetical protein